MGSEGEKENQSCLELLELLAVLLCLEVLDLQDVELDGLGEGTALTDSHTVALLDATEAGGAVGSEVGVTLLITVVLGDVVEVLTTDDDGAVHLGGADDTGEDAATDRDRGGEGALLVDVGASDGGTGCAEAKTDVLVETGELGAGLDLLALGEDATTALGEHHLTLVCTLGLFCHFCEINEKKSNKKEKKRD